MTREQALEVILEMTEDLPVVSSTGKISREIYEIRQNRGEKQRDFFMLGSLGCTASVAMGAAIGADKKIVAIDGDGSVLMKMGTLATIGQFKPNIIHFVMDNNAHDSTGGQPAASPNWTKLFKACGYPTVIKIESIKKLKKSFDSTSVLKLPMAIIVEVEKGARKNLGRPTLTTKTIKNNFMKYLA